MKNDKTLMLVCDLDNTLYDWVSYYVNSFYAMVDKAVEVLDVNKEILLDNLKEVHQIHHDSECPFALLETQIIKSLFPNSTKQELYRQLAPVFLEFNLSRRNTLKLHPYVHETLQTILEANIKIVAHTEANLFAIIDRLERLKITHFFEKIYCRERIQISHPNGSPKNSSYTQFPFKKVVELSDHPRKPDVGVLLEICASLSIKIENVAYVGDSMARDMLMAANANIYSIFAEYGSKHDKKLYEKLVRVTHWSSEDVKREVELQKNASNIRPDYILKNSFSEILVPLGLKLI